MNPDIYLANLEAAAARTVATTPNPDDFAIALQALEFLQRAGDRDSRLVARTALRRIELDRRARAGRDRASYMVAVANCSTLRPEDIP